MILNTYQDSFETKLKCSNNKNIFYLFAKIADFMWSKDWTCTFRLHIGVLSATYRYFFAGKNENDIPCFIFAEEMLKFFL